MYIKQKMRNFKKAVVYKICCKNKEVKKFYIGSSTDLQYRIWKHKYCCNTPHYYKYNSPLYVFLRNNGGWDNFIFEIIYEYEDCENDEQLRIKENEFIEIYKDKLVNKVKSYNPKKK